MRLAHRSCPALIALILLCRAAIRVPAADWPQWRGLNRDGISQEKELLPRWPQEGPKLVWKATDIGSGYSTPAVAGDRLYLLANESLENEFVAAISASDGKRIWSTRLGNVGQPKQMPSFPAARSTPTVEGDALGGVVKVGDYLYGTTPQALLCLEFQTGQVKWKDRALGAASICVADGRLYLHGENGEVALIEASPEGYREQGRFTPPDPPKRANNMDKAWVYPVVAGGKLYVRDHGCLWCYEIRAGAGNP